MKNQELPAFKNIRDAMNTVESDETEPVAQETARVVGVHRGYTIVERSASPSVVSAGGLKVKYVVLDPATETPVWRQCQTLKQAKQMINFELAKNPSTR